MSCKFVKRFSKLFLNFFIYILIVAIFYLFLANSQ